MIFVGLGTIITSTAMTDLYLFPYLEIHLRTVYASWRGSAAVNNALWRTPREEVENLEGEAREDEPYLGNYILRN